MKYLVIPIIPILIINFLMDGMDYIKNAIMRFVDWIQGNSIESTPIPIPEPETTTTTSTTTTTVATTSTTISTTTTIVTCESSYPYCNVTCDYWCYLSLTEDICKCSDINNELCQLYCNLHKYESGRMVHSYRSCFNNETYDDGCCCYPAQ